MTVTLRDATPGDAPAIAALHAANWRNAYADVLDPAFLAEPVDADRLQLWTDRFAVPGPAQEVVVADGADGSIVGFTCLYHAQDPRWGALVDNLHSAAQVRGQGIGTILLREAARRIAPRDPATGVSLWVYEKNAPARGFYAALGGEIVESKAQDWEVAQGEMLLRCHWRSAATLAKAMLPAGR